MSKVAAYYHIVFCTKGREMTIPKDRREDLYRFIWKIVKDHECKLLRIGGIANHVHMLLDLNPSVALADIMKEVKGKSSNWMKHSQDFLMFKGWASEYFASTVSPEHKYMVIEYIKGQESHHYGRDLAEELKDMYRIADLPYHDKDMM